MNVSSSRVVRAKDLFRGEAETVGVRYIAGQQNSHPPPTFLDVPGLTFPPNLLPPRSSMSLEEILAEALEIVETDNLPRLYLARNSTSSNKNRNNYPPQ